MCKLLALHVFVDVHAKKVFPSFVCTSRAKTKSTELLSTH